MFYFDYSTKVPRWYFGGVASAGAACVTHPLDLLKVICSPVTKKLEIVVSYQHTFTGSSANPTRPQSTFSADDQKNNSDPRNISTVRWTLGVSASAADLLNYEIRGLRSKF